MRADADIVQEVLAGKREAFSELVERHYPLVYGLALSSLRNRDDAEDAAQESFLRALKALNTLKEPARFASWLSSIVRNICRDFRARQSSEQHFAHLAAETPRETSEPDGNDLHELLWDHVMALPPDEREILILYYFSKHNTRAIAELLAISIPAAEKRLQRARQSLGTRMEAALNETMDQHRHRDSSVQHTALAVIACPVPWKPIVAPAAGIAGTVASVLSSWKTIAAFVAIGLIGGGYFLRDEFVPATPVAPVNAAAQETSHGVPSSENAKADASVANPAESKPGFFQVLAKAIGRGPTGPTIHVISLDDDSKPIEGAQIAIFNEEDPSNILKGTTGPDGNCVLSRVPVSGALLSVTHPDYRPQRRISITLKRDESKTIALEPYIGVTLAGRVVEASTKQPLRTFSLQVTGIENDMPLRWRDGFVPYISEDGRFEIECGSAPTEISAIAPGFALQSVNLMANGIEPDNILIALEPAYVLTVSTVDEQNNPVSDAAISVSPDLVLGGDDDESATEQTWTTDDEGHVVIDDLGVSPQSVIARHSDYVSSQMSLDRNPPSHALAATIVMHKGVSLTGTVRLGENPISGAYVSLRTVDSDRTQESFTANGKSDGNGKFALNNVPAGNYELYSSLRAASVRYEVRIDGLKPQSFDVVFPVHGTDMRLARISGAVTINGEPANMVVVEVSCDSDYQYHNEVPFSSGSYVVDDIPPGHVQFKLRAVAADSRQQVTRTFEMNIDPGAEVTQDADFAGNAPLVVHVDAPEGRQTSVYVHNESDLASGQLVGTGDIEIDLLPPGSYTVSAQFMTGPDGFRASRGNNESVLHLWQPTTESKPEPVEQKLVLTSSRQTTTVETREGEVTRVEFTLGDTK